MIRLIKAAMAALVAMAVIAPVAKAARKSEFTFHTYQKDEGRLTVAEQANFRWASRSCERIAFTRGNSILGQQLLRRFNNPIKTQEAAIRTNEIPPSAATTRQLSRCSALLD